MGLVYFVKAKLGHSGKLDSSGLSDGRAVQGVAGAGLEFTGRMRMAEKGEESRKAGCPGTSAAGDRSLSV